MLPDDLPQDLPTFIARFGTDEACRDYLFRQRWPDGFRCRACGHGEAWALARRNIYECAACGQQHSLLKGTIFEQTKTGLAKWFLAIYLVTSSKGGIAATELQRQMGFGSYQTAWSWLHKIRKAMVRPDRQPLSERVEADETYLGGCQAGPAGPRRCRQGAGRRCGRSRPRQGPRAPARPAAACSPARCRSHQPRRLSCRQRRQAGRRGDRRVGRLCRPAGQGIPPRADQSQRLLGRRRAPPAGHPPGLRPRQALAARHPSRCRRQEASPGLPRRVRLPLQPPHRQEASATASPA